MKDENVHQINFSWVVTGILIHDLQFTSPGYAFDTQNLNVARFLTFCVLGTLNFRLKSL